ncbi:primosomal protein N', partial [Lysobacteraceae bacterium NML91-0213]
MNSADGTPDAPCLSVALPVPLPRLFDYRPPAGAGLPAQPVGCRVRVPFGPRELVGVVAAVAPPEHAGEGLRDAVAWLDEAPLLAGELLESLRWLSRYLHAPLGEVLATALPATLRRGESLPDSRTWGWTLTAAG